MHVIIISESLIIRKGIADILQKENVVGNISESHVYSDMYKEDYDLVLLDLSKNTKQYLADIEEIKKTRNTKVMVLDFYEDKNMFSQCMKIGIDGYILANINAEDVTYAVRQLSKNKKYYDSELIESYMNKKNFECLDILTNREKEILMGIAKGYTNLEIAKNLFITEHTVKKHTSNIFAKLNLKDRMQAALYAYDSGIVSI